MAIAWITYRTERAVNNIKYGRWTPTKAAIRDLLSALRSGNLIAHGMFEGESDAASDRYGRVVHL